MKGCTVSPHATLPVHSTPQDNLKEAAEICAEVLTKAPRNARAHYILGAIAQREGRRRDAVDYACRAAQLRPDLAPLQFAAGSLLYRDKSFAAAIELYKAAVERDPTKADYHLGGEVSALVGPDLANSRSASRTIPTVVQSLP